MNKSIRTKTCFGGRGRWTEIEPLKADERTDKLQASFKAVGFSVSIDYILNEEHGALDDNNHPKGQCTLLPTTTTSKPKQQARAALLLAKHYWLISDV